jgi:hypothetical protein
MTSGTTERQEAQSGHSGTVFDIGYQRYTGPREGRKRARLAVFKDGVRTSLGFGRGGRAKILPWFFIAVLGSIALIMALIAGAADRIAGPEAAAQMNLPSHSDYYGIASILIFVFAAVVAPELLCPDRRDGVIRVLHRHDSGRLVPSADSARRSCYGGPGSDGLLIRQLVGHTAIPRVGHRDGRLHDYFGDAHRLLHDTTGIRLGVLGRAVCHHDALHHGIGV